MNVYIRYQQTLMYESWYHYIKLKYGDRAKLCYTDSDSFIIHIITEDFYKDISDDVKIWFDTSNFDENDKTSSNRNQRKYMDCLKMNQDERL